MAELVDAADSKSVFERSGSSSLPRGTKIKKGLALQGLFFRPQKSDGHAADLTCRGRRTGDAVDPALHSNTYQIC